MSDQDQEQQRNEQATPFKLDQARRKGSVPKGADLGYFLSLLVLAAVLYLWGTSLVDNTLRLSAVSFSRGAGVDFAAGAPIRWILKNFVAHLMLWMPLFALLVAIGVIGSLVQTGPVLSFTPLKPDWSRISPAQGFKKFLSVKIVIETGKSILKILALGWVLSVVLRAALPLLAGLMNSDIRMIPGTVLDLVIKLLLRCLLVMVPIVALDLIFSRREYRKKMMMSRRDILDEHKQREGDPRIRSRRKALQNEARSRSQSLRRVKDADLLITNPTRLAVALKYDQAGMGAPAVIAKGAGQLARLMREMASRHGVPIVQNKPLAAALFKRLGIDQQIPEEFYARIARLLVWVNAIRAQRQSFYKRDH